MSNFLNIDQNYNKSLKIISRLEKENKELKKQNEELKKDNKFYSSQNRIFERNLQGLAEKAERAEIILIKYQNNVIYYRDELARSWIDIHGEAEQWLENRAPTSEEKGG